MDLGETNQKTYHNDIGGMALHELIDTFTEPHHIDELWHTAFHNRETHNGVVEDVWIIERRSSRQIEDLEVSAMVAIKKVYNGRQAIGAIIITRICHGNNTRRDVGKVEIKTLFTVSSHSGRFRMNWAR